MSRLVDRGRRAAQEGGCAHDPRPREIVDGKSAIARSDTGEQRIACEHLVLATGSEPAALEPAVRRRRPVVDRGAGVDARARTSRRRRRRLYRHGARLAFARLGASVTVIEAMPNILPLYDEELTLPVARRAADLGIDFLTRRAGARSRQGRAQRRGRRRRADSVAADKALVAVGRRPCTQTSASNGSTSTMAGPFVRIDDRCATSMRNVWAVGDVTGEPMLAHRAMAQGEMVAEIIAGSGALRSSRDCLGLFYRPGDRLGRLRARGGAGGARRDSDGDFSVPRQRPGDDEAGRRRSSGRRAQG